MILQDLCQSEILPSELYFRGDAFIKDGVMTLNPGDITSFDTYFNLFSVSVWRHYTTVKSLSVEIIAAGKGKASLIGFDKDFVHRRTLAEVFISNTDSSSTILYNGPISDVPEHLYVSLRAGDIPIFIRDIIYSTVDVCPEPVRVACSFCTFRREKELMQNVRRIAGLENIELFISDNGHTLREEDFSGIKGLHLFQNRNYGGSAGFTRCMMEAVLKDKYPRITHVLLMDDDALIEPYVLERTIALLSVLKPEHRKKMIGGAMLSLEHPTLQIENGAWIDPKTWRIEIPGRNYDLAKTEKIIDNEKEDRVNYNGWFYCCIPAALITEDNLPLPMFIHADDQEYGVRNGLGVIRMNGICVWHPNPWSKKRAYIEYYDARNGMIALSQTNPELPWIYAWVRSAVTALRFMMVYRYDDAEYMLRGYSDYYRGPDWFKSQDPEKMNLDLMKWKKTESYSASRTELEHLINDPSNEMKSKKIGKLLNLLVPAFKQKAIFDINLPRACIFAFAVKQYCVVDPNTGAGYKLEKDYRHLFTLIGRLLSLGVFMARKHREIHRDWGTKAEEFATLRFWRDYLGLYGEE